MQRMGHLLPCAVRAKRELQELQYRVGIGMTNRLWNRGSLRLAVSQEARRHGIEKAAEESAPATE
jgi:hypothetical protein